ncbi:hypothetical protein PybrP1_006533 [[Pythium] brassicae (nom. inval.)]|nr:hypothetical protein PybrP1_006533 [[Pythium] brassicae (nom. inval.)]
MHQMPRCRTDTYLGRLLGAVDVGDGDDKKVKDTLLLHTVDLLNLPQPIPKSLARTRLRQAHGAAGARMAVLQLPDRVPTVKAVVDAYPVALKDDFVLHRSMRAKREEVDTIKYDSNFVLPTRLVRKVESAIESEIRTNDRQQMYEARAKPNSAQLDGVQTSETPTDLLLRLATNLVSYIYSLKNFHVIKAKCKDWEYDCWWLQLAWDGPCRPLEFLGRETSSVPIQPPLLPKTNQRMADGILAVLRTSSLTTQFRLLSNNATILLRKVVGYLGGVSMLNGAVVNMCCQFICDQQGKSVFLSSHAFGLGTPPIRRAPGSHLWQSLGVIVVTVAYPSKITAQLYEQMVHDHCATKLDKVWKNRLLPFLKMWHRDSKEVEPLPRVVKTWVKNPKQPDGSSCGVLVVAAVYSMLRECDELTVPLLQIGQVSAEEVHVMRLRAMWLLLCATVVEHPHHDGVWHEETHNLLLESLSQHNN